MNYDGESYSVTGIGTCTDTDIVIPSTYEGKPVTDIGSEAFYNCTGLTSVTIPTSVTRISSEAFYCCNGLTSITIPDSITSIGYRVFEHCSALTSITIPVSVRSIAFQAFAFCDELETIFFKGTEAQWNAVDKNLKWDRDAGSETTKGTYTVVFKPETVISEGFAFTLNSDGESYAFSRCSLTSVTIEDGVTSIGNRAFYNCRSLTSITIPNSVISIGNEAFYDCTSLTSIEIPGSVTSIGESAFSGCSSFTNVTIRNGVTSIGVSVFRNCTRLTSVTIPGSVTSIGNYVFSGCYSLESITVEEGNKVYHSSGNCIIETKSKTLIAGCKNSEMPTDGSVTSIGGSAFDECRSLTSITIPDSVTSIGNYVFSDCSKLETIYFKGTEAQWNAVTKNRYWDYKAGSETSKGTYTIVFLG